MNKRQAIIGLLATAAAYMMPKKAEAQDTFTSAAPIFTSNKTKLYLALDNMADDAIEVSYQGKTVKVSAAEIMEALSSGK
jgi:hypothetical protein